MSPPMGGRGLPARPVSFAGDACRGRPDVGSGREGALRQTGKNRRHWTARGGLLLYDEDPGEAGPILETLAHRATARVPRRAWDGDDAAHDVVVRALKDDCAALRRVRDPGTPLSAWLHGCVRNLFREKEKEKEKSATRVEELAGPAPSPFAHAVVREEVGRALALLASLPLPYGFVLYLQCVEGMSHAEIHIALRAYRRVGRDRIDQMIREGHEMCRASEDCEGLRKKWPSRYNPKKNPWFATPLPPLPPPAW